MDDKFDTMCYTILRKVGGAAYELLGKQNRQ